MATEHFQLPVPSREAEPPESVDEAFDLLIAAITDIDAILKAHATGIANKAAAGHGHDMAAIAGLVEALNTKMPASRRFRLAELEDVIGAVDAPLGYILAKSEQGWSVMTALAALGQHQHPIGEVNGLADALDAIAHDIISLGDDLLGRLLVTGPQTLSSTERAFAWGNLGLDEWAVQPIGVPIPVFDHIAGVSAPRTDKDYRFIKLTAGESGAGGYNDGVLTGESVSGSAPLVSATAVVQLTDSPLNGRTVRLINTERRFIRAGSAGTVQDDALQNIIGRIDFRQTSAGDPGAIGMSGAFSEGGTSGNAGITSTSGSAPRTRVDFNASAVARTDTETRPKNIGVAYYMRIK